MFKNVLENVIYLFVLSTAIIINNQFKDKANKEIIIEAIRQETTKIETNIESEINNKFRRIENLSTQLDNVLQSTPNLEQTKTDVPKGYVLIKIENLTNRQKRRLNIK